MGVQKHNNKICLLNNRVGFVLQKIDKKIQNHFFLDIHAHDQQKGSLPELLFSLLLLDLLLLVSMRLVRLRCLLT
jgi:hypothetical protein